MSTVTPLSQPDGISAVVAAEIRVLMARYDKTQRDLALLLGISQSQMSKRMHGTVPIDIFELEKIAHYFGVPVATLVGGTDLRPKPGDAIAVPAATQGGGDTVSYPHSAVYLEAA